MCPVRNGKPISCRGREKTGEKGDEHEEAIGKLPRDDISVTWAYIKGRYGAGK